MKSYENCRCGDDIKSVIPSAVDISAFRRAREIFKKKENDLHQKIYKMSAIRFSQLYPFKNGTQNSENLASVFFLSAIMLTNSGTREHLFVKRYTKTVPQRHDWKYQVREMSYEVMMPVDSQCS